MEKAQTDICMRYMKSGSEVIESCIDRRSEKLKLMRLCARKRRREENLPNFGRKKKRMRRHDDKRSFCDMVSELMGSRKEMETDRFGTVDCNIRRTEMVPFDGRNACLYTLKLEDKFSLENAEEHLVGIL